MSHPQLSDLAHYFRELEIDGESKNIIGNETTCITVATVYPLEDVPIILRGQAGSAKSTILDGAIQAAWSAEAIDDGDPALLVIAGSSDKAFMSGDMVERICGHATHCAIPELENVVEQPHVEDMMKRWLEGRKYTYSRSAEFGKSTDKIALDPLTIACTLANENQRLEELGEEMERRFLPLFTESSTSTNEQVHESKAEAEAKPPSLRYTGGMAKLRDIQEHYRNIWAWKADHCQSLTIVNPSAPFMSRHLPKRFTLSNTYIGYWHKTVHAMADWNFEEREIITEKNRDGDEMEYVMTTPADNWTAWTLVGKAIVYASLRLRDMGDVLMKAVPIGDEGSAATFDEVFDAVTGEGYERSQKQIKALLMQLVMAGYVRPTERELRFYRTKDYSGEMSTAIDWAAMIESTKEKVREYHPSIAKDYLRAYCEDPVALHPITGAKVKILDICETEVPKPTMSRRGTLRIDALEELGMA
jgi:hypothetical protein